MKTENVLNKIPADIAEFHNYITITDDLQKAIDTIGFTIYPRDKKGNVDFNDTGNRKEIKNQPTYIRWDWTAEESEQWSDFREQFNSTYKQYLSSPNDAELKQHLEEIITSAAAYDREHKLIYRVSNAGHTTTIQRELFLIRCDEYEYQSPLRTISLKYEKSLPFDKIEKSFLKKYIELNNHSHAMFERIQLFRENMKQLHKSLQPLWEQIPVLKDKADKATNTICLPPPNFKGAWNDVIQFTMPSSEESQRLVDDFNRHYGLFYQEIAAMCNRFNDLHAEMEWVLDISNGENDKYTDKLFKEVGDLKRKILNNYDSSLDGGSVYDDYDDFLGTGWKKVSEASDKGTDDWNTVVDEQKLLMDVYTVFTTFLSEKFSSKEGDEAEKIDLNALQKNNDTDDLKTETIKRYQSDLENNASTYFDTQDWHIILDYFTERRDEKNIDIAMERAMTQHPRDTTMLARQAGVEVNKHNYQKALELIKLAEQQGPEQHPNLFYVKANIYRELQSPELAIPVYKKLASQKGEELKWWRTNSQDCLIDIYKEKKDYEECIRLSKEAMEERKEDEYLVSNLSDYYYLNNQPEQSVKLLNDFLINHPDSAVCHHQLGKIHFELKQLDDAIECYTTAFEIDRDENFENMYDKGIVLMEKKNYTEAVKCFELCILYFKLSKEFHLAASECYANLHIESQAIYHYRKAIALDPESLEPMKAIEGLKRNNN